MAKQRPTSRTLQLLRKDGDTAQVVERWQLVPKHPAGGVRQDLFGCIDVIAIQGGCIVGIQCGAASGHSAHVKKCLAEPRLVEWLKAGGLFEIHSWGQSKAKANAKAKRWSLRIAQITLRKGNAVVSFDHGKPIDEELDLDNNDKLPDLT